MQLYSGRSIPNPKAIAHTSWTERAMIMLHGSEMVNEFISLAIQNETVSVLVVFDIFT